MSIPSAAYKMSLLSVLHTLGANMPGAKDLVEKFEQAVREDLDAAVRIVCGHCGSPVHERCKDDCGLDENSEGESP